MSASSNWVTCGIITQLRASAGARDLLDARERLDLDRSELGEVDLGPRRQPQSPSPAPPPGAEAPLRDRLLDEALDVFLEDAALRPRALHSRHVDAQLAREPAHARARVGGARRRRTDPAAQPTGRGARLSRRRGAAARRAARRRRGGLPAGVAAWRPRGAGCRRRGCALAGGVRGTAFEQRDQRCPRSPCRRPSPQLLDRARGGAGTSIVALSLSSVISESSFFTGRPA